MCRTRSRYSRRRCASIPTTARRTWGSPQALIHTYRSARLAERARLLARADETATRATAVAPDSAQAQSVKAEILGLQQRFDAALATYDQAIALDRNLTSAHVGRARSLIAAGRAAEAVAPVERAIRLSPRDPDLYLWYYVACHAYTHLARDTATIDWCLKSVATGKTFWHAWADLASAYAWRGQTAEATAAVAEILKLRPGLTAPQMAEEGFAYSDNATFRKEYERILEGVRKAGLPER